MNTPIHWFEIPVADMARAIAFYENVFQISLHAETTAGMTLAVFPHTKPATGGALCQSPQLPPGSGGCIPYLDGGDDLAQALARAEAGGAAILLGKTLISPEIGYMALFRDCEGNTIGLHSLH
jgi:predicted enzyme related to lactoylglutathione lyase